MSRGLEGCLRDFLGFPRVSGDEPVAQVPVYLDAEFSPRERG